MRHNNKDDYFRDIAIEAQLLKDFSGHLLREARNKDKKKSGYEIGRMTGALAKVNTLYGELLAFLEQNGDS
jgi:hypothetical protein